MSRKRSRRALLASIGVAALAGCTGRQGTGGEGTTTDRATTTPDPEPDPPDRIGSDWPMPAHDPGRSNYARGASGPTDRVERLWTVSTDAELSAPVVAGSTLYVGGNDGVVRALDARTGERRWRQSVGGPARTPHVLDERVFVPLRDDADRGVVALDAAEGTERWTAGTADPREVVVTPHGVYRVTGGSTLDVVAFEADDGTERWRTDVDDPWVPVLFASDGTVYLSSGDRGRIPWKFDMETGEVVGSEPREGYDFTAARFALDGTVYRVDPFMGSVRGDGWGRGLDAAGEVAVAGGPDRVFYVGSDGDRPGLYGLSRADGTVEWSADAVTAVVQRPLAAEEVVVVNAEDALLGLDPVDGTERWARPGEAVGDRIALADDLLFTTAGSEVRAFRPP